MERRWLRDLLSIRKTADMNSCLGNGTRTLSKRQHDILPTSLPPIGINRDQAAAFIGVSATLFDRLVHDGLMPDARVLRSRLVWDVDEIAAAFRALPHRSEAAAVTKRSSWD